MIPPYASNGESCAALPVSFLKIEIYDSMQLFAAGNSVFCGTAAKILSIQFVFPHAGPTAASKSASPAHMPQHPANRRCCWIKRAA